MTTRTISNKHLSPEEDLRELLYVVLQQDGGNPSQLLDLLNTIVQQTPWEKLGMSFPEFIERPFADGGVGWSQQAVRTVLELQHRYEKTNAKKAKEMAAMRRMVTTLLNPALPKNGANQYKSGFDNIKPTSPDWTNYNKTQGGTSPAYALRRLKRDNPELAEKVIGGKLSANAAAIEAGFRTKTITVPLDVERAAATLRRHFRGHDLDMLINLLGHLD